MRKTQILLLLSAATIGFVSCHRNGKISKEFSEETLPDSKKGSKLKYLNRKNIILLFIL